MWKDRYQYFTYWKNNKFLKIILQLNWSFPFKTILCGQLVNIFKFGIWTIQSENFFFPLQNNLGKKPSTIGFLIHKHVLFGTSVILCEVNQSLNSCADYLTVIGKDFSLVSADHADHSEIRLQLLALMDWLIDSAFNNHFCLLSERGTLRK